MLSRVLSARSSPSLETTKAAVEPVPRPRTMPDLTYSMALSAASFLRSSWERVGGDGEGDEKVMKEGGGVVWGRRLRWERGVLWRWRDGRERRERVAMVVREMRERRRREMGMRERDGGERW